MKDFNKNEFLQEYKKKQTLIRLWIKRIYVLTFNIYAWFWVIREIFVRNTTEFEPYLLWFFTTVGMYYFVLENQDIYFKGNK